MLSIKTTVELIAVVEQYVERIVDRIYTVFDLDHLVHPSLGKFNTEKKINILLKDLMYSTNPGPYSGSRRMDLLQFMIEHFYRYQDDPGNKNLFYRDNLDHITYNDRFAYKYPSLTNAVKRDGYIIVGRTIKKMLPEEIEEAKTESELYSLLNKFGFATAKGHLDQAIANHSQGNWAGANGQFRSFFESLLMEINDKIQPGTPAQSAVNAIKHLSSTANPPFLREDLNEVEHTSCKKPFIDGLWKRLHPQGSHPGLSDEEDSTFRYHVLVVTAYDLLKRLEKYR